MTKILQSKFVSEYGTLIVLLILFTYYTVATWGVVHPVSDGAARDVAEKIIKQKSGAQVVIVEEPVERGLSAFCADHPAQLAARSCKTCSQAICPGCFIEVVLLGSRLRRAYFGC